MYVQFWGEWVYRTHNIAYWSGAGHIIKGYIKGASVLEPGTKNAISEIKNGSTIFHLMSFKNY
jgi:hypothetical protein